MKTLVTLLITAGVATGCTQTAQVDAAIQKTLPQFCDASQYGFAAFQAVAATGAVSENNKARVDQAWSVLKPLCADPGKATATDVAVAAANAYIIAKALRDAKGA